jgi:hypothetical protein
MSTLEDRLRDALSERADHSPVSPDAWERVLARARRRRRFARDGRAWRARYVVPVLAAAAVAGVIIGANVIVRQIPSPSATPGGATRPSAAAPSCGVACGVDILSVEFGHHHSPNFLLDVFQAHARIGQAIILYRASNIDPAEDFRVTSQGTVLDFYRDGLVSAAFAQHYGCVPADKTGTGDFSRCFGTDKSFNDPAFEIEYAPDGVNSGLCVGVASTPTRAEGVTLQRCGASSGTVWAIDLYDQPFESLVLGYYPLINGSDANFSDPFALTYPLDGYPTDMPRPQLMVYHLSGFTRGFPPIVNLASIDDAQLWGADLRTRG